MLATLGVAPEFRVVHPWGLREPPRVLQVDPHTAPVPCQGALDGDSNPPPSSRRQVLTGSSLQAGKQRHRASKKPPGSRSAQPGPGLSLSL